MKLATKGTLDTRAIIPRVERTLTKLATLAFTHSTSTFNVPADAKIIMVTATIMKVSAMPEALLNSCPTK